LLCVYADAVHGTLNADEYVDNDVASQVVPIPTILYWLELHHAHQSLHDNVVDTSLGLQVVPFGVIVVVGAVLSNAFMVMVFGLWSRSTHPLLVPPLSCTWKVNVVYGLPYALDGGMYFKFPLVISVAKIYCPAEILLPFNWIVHNDGNVVIFTLLNVFGGLSLESINQKLPVVNVY